MGTPSRPRLAIWALLPCLGCAVGAQSPEPTFHGDVAAIVYRNCAPCHHPGGAAPFSLMDYEDVRDQGRLMLVVTRSGYMPPWQPVEGYGKFQGERGLTPDEQATLERWVKDGAVEGDPAVSPPRPEFPSGWRLGEPDLVVEMDDPFTLPAEGFDIIRNFVIPVPIDAPRWVRTVELHPGNKSVVHHAVVAVDRTSASRRLDGKDETPGFPGMRMGNAQSPDGQQILWAPGTSPDPGDPRIAWRLEPGSDLVVQLHLVPTGKPEPVRASMAFYFAEDPPELWPQELLLQDTTLDLPAGDANYLATDVFDLPVTVKLLRVFPHAHYLGKRMEVFAELPQGEREWLLRIDDWDFNWQDDYRYIDPPVLPAGTRLHMRYTFDNSADNPRNPSDPPIRVVGGDRSVDEMATLALQVLTEDPADGPRLRMALFQRRVEQKPGDADAHYNLGVVYAETGNLESAAQHYARAAELEPGNAETHFYLANTLYKLKRSSEAERHYRLTVELNPEVAEAHLILGWLQERSGRAEGAAVSYRRALALDPGMTPAREGLARLRRSEGP